MNLREFLKKNCMDEEYPESLNMQLFFRFGDMESTDYCFDACDSEIGINEADDLTVIFSDGTCLELPLDNKIEKLTDGELLSTDYSFQVGKINFFSELG